MAIRKLKHVETSADRALADRVARARRADQPRDPTGKHHVACADLARAAGLEPDIVIDAWDEAATTKTYDGMPRATAERIALDIVRSIYQPKGSP